MKQVNNQYKLFFVHPANLGPYHYARFAAINKIMPQFTVVTISGDEAYRPWATDLSLKPCRIIQLPQGENITSLLEKNRPDAVAVVSYASRIMRQAARWAKRHNIPSILVNDSWYGDRPRYYLKEIAKRLLIKPLFDAAFISGERASAYAEYQGIDPHRIWRGYDVIDNNHFENTGCSKPNNLHLPEKFFFCVSRLSQEKNINFLIAAFSRYIESGGKWHLVIAGTGPQEAELKAKVSSAIKPFVHWLGWTLYNDLPYIYSKAACFVLSSSSETWGLVVNEAMAAGLPVLISRKCGCLPELCKRGINGFDFDPKNMAELVKLMIKISSGDYELERMGNASKDIVRPFSVENWAIAFHDCVATLVENR